MNSPVWVRVCDVIILVLLGFLMAMAVFEEQLNPEYHECGPGSEESGHVEFHGGTET